MCICGTTKAYSRLALRSAATWTFIMAGVHTRALTAPRPIKPTSPRCHSAWQPNPGRGSTYRRGKSVQTTGATSLALEHPLGLGPLQFYRLFVEDPHNTFLNAFMSGGWLAGFGYLSLCAVTLVMGTRFLFARTPWQPLYHAIYAAYVGVVGESTIIDIDHWRHYFLILGVLWGLMAV